MTTFGEHIAARREHKGWSQRELGRRCGVSYGQIQKIEAGTVESPGIQIVLSLAKALGLHPMELIAAYEGKTFDPQKVPVEDQNAALLDAFREFLDTQKEPK